MAAAGWRPFPRPSPDDLIGRRGGRVGQEMTVEMKRRRSDDDDAGRRRRWHGAGVASFRPSSKGRRWRRQIVPRQIKYSQVPLPNVRLDPQIQLTRAKTQSNPVKTRSNPIKTSKTYRRSFNHSKTLPSVKSKTQTPLTTTKNQ